MHRVTLQEVVFRLVQEGKIHSEEFEALSAYYGVDKLRELYKREMRRRKDRQDHRESQLAETQKKWGTKDAPGGEEWM